MELKGKIEGIYQYSWSLSHIAVSEDEIKCQLGKEVSSTCCLFIDFHQTHPCNIRFCRRKKKTNKWYIITCMYNQLLMTNYFTVKLGKPWTIECCCVEKTIKVGETANSNVILFVVLKCALNLTVIGQYTIVIELVQNSSCFFYDFESSTFGQMLVNCLALRYLC